MLRPRPLQRGLRLRERALQRRDLRLRVLPRRPLQRQPRVGLQPHGRQAVPVPAAAVPKAVLRVDQARLQGLPRRPRRGCWVFMLYLVYYKFRARLARFELFLETPRNSSGICTRNCNRFL